MNEQHAVKTQSDFNQIGQILQKFIPYWPLFVLSVTLALAVAYIKLRAEQPIFVAYAKILLKDPNKGSDSKVLDELNIVGEKKVVENEILVLRSAGLMQEVVRRLSLSATVYNEGRVRVEELYGENSPVQFVPVNRDSVNWGGQYYFSVDWTKGEIEIDNKRVPFNQELVLSNTRYKVVPNQDYNKTVQGKNYFVVFNSVEGEAGSLAGSLSANPISSTSSVIDVSLSTPVPEKGKAVLTILFKVYNDYALIEKNQSAANTLKFIEDRLASVALDLDSVEQNVVDFREDVAPIDLTASAQTLFSQANQFEQQKTQIDLQLTVLQNVKRSLSSGGSVPSLGLVSDPTLSSLLGEMQAAQFKLEELQTTNGPQSDAVIAAKQSVASVRQKINENVRNLEATLTTQRNSFSGLMGSKNSQLRRNPQKEKAFQTISRQLGVKNTIYSYLLEKREETALNSAATITDLRVLDRASAYGPVSPVPKAFYTRWLIIGLLIPAAFVFIKDLLNRKVQMRQEIEGKTSVPIVAEIAQVNSEDPIVIKEGKRTAIAEQFRALRTNLTYMGLGEQTNTILVTSSVSGEGKSFMAVNLAVSFTLIGKKVALLELDLRKPKVSKLLQVKNDLGISNYLVNQATITDIIKPTEIKDLFILSSGIIPPNPAELIQREKFKQLMAEVKERFDYVIIDTAPVGPVADTFLLKEYADATVYVVRQNKTQRMYLKMIEDVNRNKRFKNLCIVFNGLKKKGFSYGAYGYGNYGATGNGYYVVEEEAGGIKLFGSRVKKAFGIKS
ncbi:MAG TPA: polysaccharide biosynthesis tyrosine autokinase [Flavisolibacter sp.]|nr:polysaccharide biosynthesis tyrosine autokinase [Flavisolibacter sp.]